ncbi:MAG: MBL fold metallo-hydrolase [Acidimicrobiales bacterium]
MRTDTTCIWLDAGPGTLANLQRHVSVGDLSAVVVTHEHPDHCLELPVLRNAMRFALDLSGLRVITTAGVRDLVDDISDGAEPTFVWEVVTDGSTIRVGDLELRFVRSDHPVETYAVVIGQDQRRVFYSADTGAGLDPASVGTGGHGVDLAIIEATLPPDREGTYQHLSGRQAGAMARDLGARRLLLTHLSPGTDGKARQDEAETTFDSPVELATIHHSYEV